MSDDDTSIKIIPNGPYVVAGGVPLRPKEPVVSEHDEPLTWRSGPAAETGGQYLLCRCGQSSNKPYCDSTHAKIEWDGSESATDVPYEERRTSLGGHGIEVFDDRSTCAHAGFCGTKARNIWNMADDTGDTDVRARAMAMVERCPSGALTYEVDGEPIEPDLPRQISPTRNGPLWVTGGIPVTRSDGRPLETRNRVTLCRCGQSGNKPLCDGSHYDAGFEG